MKLPWTIPVCTLIRKCAHWENPSVKPIEKITGISPQDVMILTRQLSQFVRAGVPLSDGLRSLSKELSKRSVAALLEDIAADIEGGGSLSTAFERHRNIFPEFYIELIRPAESGGTLAPVLEHISSCSKNLSRMRTKIRNILIYPFFLSVFIIVLHFFIRLKVLPGFKETYEEFEIHIPVTARFFMADSIPWIGNLVFSPAFILAAVCFIFCIAGFMRPSTLSRIRLFVPFCGPICRYAAVASFADSLGILLEGNTPLLEALHLVARSSSNKILKKLCNIAAEKAKSGKTLSESIDSSYIFPHALGRLIATAEKRGRLPSELKAIASGYRQRSAVAAERFAQILEIALIIFTTTFLGGLMASLLLPLVQMIEALK